MASYRGHLAFSTALGAAYGGAAVWQLEMDWGPAVLGAGLTAVGGMLPDLDSDSGVPVRELFGLAAVTAPFLLLRRFAAHGFSPDQMLVMLGGIYLAVRYGVSAAFKKVTVHRGMFHSIPAMLVTGLLVFLAYHNPDLKLRLYVACGAILGFLSHLVLDEMCSVDLSGATVKLNNFAGSALKLFSASWPATLACWALLAGLVYVVTLDFGGPEQTWRAFEEAGREMWDAVARRGR